jgi:FAD/FMN-containing dehydrogenase
MTTRLSWGRAHRFAHAVARPTRVDAACAAFAAAQAPRLAVGCGRSYGDSGLNADGLLIDTTGLDRFVAFDAERGRLRAEAGVTLARIVDLLARRRAADGSGWFLPVSPGTAFVTLGGAVANDVHGKNHHRMGSFGHHVRGLRLLRSDEGVIDCGPERHGELFRATVGGLGLTGVILEVELQLRRVPGFAVANEDVRFADLDTFYGLAAESADRFEYTVAWIDCLAAGRGLGRGLFSRAAHVPGPIPVPRAGTPRFAVPFALPVSPLNRWTVKAFNALHWRRVRLDRPRRAVVPVTRILYPLDAIADWNRLYGRRGFFQYQCVLPTGTARDGVRALLSTIAAAGEGSFLAVLKTFGARPAAGLLSFPMPGTTLAIDFPDRGATTAALFARLDAIVAEAGGRLYPAKDGRMSAALFHATQPNLDRFAAQLDPALSSSFWRRVGDTVHRLDAAA